VRDINIDIRVTSNVGTVVSTNTNIMQVNVSQVNKVILQKVEQKVLLQQREKEVLQLEKKSLKLSLGKSGKKAILVKGYGAGSGDLNYVYYQNTESAEWIVENPFTTKIPSTTVLDENDNKVGCEVYYDIDNKNFHVKPDEACTGRLLLN